MTDFASPRSIAVLADVHGNTWALDAVLADVARRGVAQIINLGDSVYGCLDPAGAAARLMQPPIVSIAGNQDRIVFDPPAPVRDSFDYRFVTSRMAPEQIAWLQGL